MKIAMLIIQNWDSVAAVIAAIVGAVAAVRRGEVTKLKAICFKLVTDAEAELGSGTGKLKLSSVIAEIYPRIPAALKPFIREKQLEKLISDVLEEAKKQWAANAALKAIVAPDTNT